MVSLLHVLNGGLELCVLLPRVRAHHGGNLQLERRNSPLGADAEHRVFSSAHGRGAALAGLALILAGVYYKKEQSSSSVP